MIFNYLFILLFTVILTNKQGGNYQRISQTDLILIASFTEFEYIPAYLHISQIDLVNLRYKGHANGILQVPSNMYFCIIVDMMSC